MKYAEPQREHAMQYILLWSIKLSIVEHFFNFELPNSAVKVKFERFLLIYKSTEN